MADLQTALSQALTQWEPQPEITEEKQMETKKNLFAPTNNVSRETFNYILHNKGCTVNDITKELTKKGYKESSVSSLAYQMLKQGMIRRREDGMLEALIPEYTPVKTRRPAKKKTKGKSTITKPSDAPIQPKQPKQQSQPHQPHQPTQNIAAPLPDTRYPAVMLDLVWNGDVGEIKINKHFLVADRMVQLDGLQDWIYELQDLYNFMVKAK
jgi:hypothetical protein